MNLIRLARKAGFNLEWVSNKNAGEYQTFCVECWDDDSLLIYPALQYKGSIGVYGCRNCKISGNNTQFLCRYLGYDIDEARRMVQGKSGVQEWPHDITQQVNKAHTGLLEEYSIITRDMISKGITEQQLIAHKIGIFMPNLPFDFTGLQSGPDNQFNSTMFIQSLREGIIIPSFDAHDNVIDIKIYQSGKYSKYISMTGNFSCHLIVGTLKTGVVVVVRSYFDALALENILGDIACVVVAHDFNNAAKILAKNARYLIILYTNSYEDKRMIQKWESKYSHAISLQTYAGQEICQLIKQGFNIRNLINISLQRKGIYLS